MYVFVLTISYLCHEQSAIVAENHGCSTPIIGFMPVPVAQERVAGYFASESGCATAMRKERAAEVAVETHLAPDALALRQAHYACTRHEVAP